jgi:small subunit ribosomal protein S20
VKSHVKNAVKDVRLAVTNKNKEEAQSALLRAHSVLDKAASKGVIHWRNAARRISRLSHAVNKIDA